MIEQAKKQDILTMSGHKMILILRQRQTAGLKLSWLLPARARMPLLILALLIFRLMSIHSALLEGGVLEAEEDLDDKTDNKEETAELDAEDAFRLELRKINLKCQTEPLH